MKTLSLSIGIKVAKATLASVCPGIVLAPQERDVEDRTRLLGFLPGGNSPEGWPVYEITTVVVEVLQQVYDRGERVEAGGRSPGVLATKPFNLKALLAGTALLALPALLAVPAMLAVRNPASELPGRRKLAALKARLRGLLPASTPPSKST